MSTTVRESSHVSRKLISQGGHGQGYQNNQNSLENNLDALLEDLQTSVSRSTTPSRGVRALSPQVEYRTVTSPTRLVSDEKCVTPGKTVTTTTEKYVTSGNSGAVSGIPGLELLDAELQNVQPGQSKTVAYKQVSYQYQKNLDPNPKEESWAMSDNILSTNTSPYAEEIRERSYEESRPAIRHRSPEPSSKTSTINRELLYDTSSSSRSRQVSPLPAGQHRDVSYTQETSTYGVQEPRTVDTNVTTVHTSHHSDQLRDPGIVEYVPLPAQSPTLPINLAPGPNTKVTTTVKTYTYELPGSPENYLPGSTLPRGVVVPGDQTITYTLPRSGNTEKTITYHAQQVTNSPLPGQTVSYQVSPDTPSHQIRYASPPPPEVTTKTTTTRQEGKFYREEHHTFPPTGQSVPPPPPPVNTTVVYHSSPPPANKDSVTTITRNEKYYQYNNNYPNGDGPHCVNNNNNNGPNAGPGRDRPDHPTNTTTIIYENQPAPPPKIETRTTVNEIHEYYPNRSPSRQNYPPGDDHKPNHPGHTTINYYTTAPPQTNPPQTNTTVYKYSNTTTTIPPNRHPDDHEVLLPKPFPTNGIQLYPANGKQPPTNNGQGPPEKLEDLMASFSDSERSVLADISNQEQQQKKIQHSTDLNISKKEVDFVPHTPPKVKSKNVAGPPVYYPPGSAEFTRKEEAGGAMAQSSGGWEKARGKYEYEASSKSKSKSSSGAAVVPVCLPLCCAMPCVIM